MIDIATIAIDTGIYNVNASNKAIIVLYPLLLFQRLMYICSAVCISTIK